MLATSTAPIRFGSFPETRGKRAKHTNKKAVVHKRTTKNQKRNSANNNPTAVDSTTGEILISSSKSTPKTKIYDPFYEEGDPYKNSAGKDKILVEVIASSPPPKPPKKTNSGTYYKPGQQVKIPDTVLEIPIPQKEEPAGLLGSIKESVSNFFGVKKKSSATLKRGRVTSNKKQKLALANEAKKLGINKKDLVVIGGHGDVGNADKNLEAKIKKTQQKVKAEVAPLKKYLSEIKNELGLLSKQVSRKRIKKHEAECKDKKVEIDNSLKTASKELAQKYRPGSKGILLKGQFRSLLKKTYKINTDYISLRRDSHIKVQRSFMNKLDLIAEKKLLRSPFVSRKFVEQAVREYNKTAHKGYEIDKWSVAVEGTGDNRYYEPIIKFKNVPQVEQIALDLNKAYKLYLSEAKKTTAASKSTRKPKRTSRKPANLQQQSTNLLRTRMNTRVPVGR